MRRKEAKKMDGERNRRGDVDILSIVRKQRKSTKKHRFDYHFSDRNQLSKSPRCRIL